MSAGQNVASPLGFRIIYYVEFDVDFWSSWGQSWVPLGVMLGSFLHFCRPKLVPEPSSNRVIFEKMIFHQILRFPTL